MKWALCVYSTGGQVVKQYLFLFWTVVLYVGLWFYRGFPDSGSLSYLWFYRGFS